MTRRASRLLLLAGTATIVLGLSKWHASQVADPPYDFTDSSRFVWSMLYVGLLAFVSYGVGLPDLYRSRRGIVLASIVSVSLSAGLMGAVQLFAGEPLIPRFVLLGTAMIMVPWLWICADLADDGRTRGAERDRVIVVGNWADATELSADLESSAERPAKIVDVVDLIDMWPSTKSTRPLIDAAEAGEATVIVLDREAQVDDRIVGQVADLHREGLRVRTLSLFHEEWLGKIPVAELERVSLLFDIGEIHRARYGRLKRMADLALSAAVLPAFLVVTPFVWLGNLVANRGSLFFRQERVGHDGKPFSIIKFRTMSGADTKRWTSADDERITSFGRLLRRTHLDELPQVVNVLRGDLSWVGPRPEQVHYVEDLRDKLPFYDVRHLVRPGVTGWAQVKYGYADDEHDALEKLQYEFYYLRHQSLRLDGRILARTVRSLVGRDGR